MGSNACSNVAKRDDLRRGAAEVNNGAVACCGSSMLLVGSPRGVTVVSGIKGSQAGHRK